MNRYTATVFVLAIAIVVIVIRQYIALAQEDISDNCADKPDIFLFEYNNSDWQGYIRIIENASCDIGFFGVTYQN